jgi:serine/threonine-protein kinase
MNAERWAEIEPLYHAALAKGPEERASYLEAACGEDPALRKEVESLLAFADGSLETPAPRSELAQLWDQAVAPDGRAVDAPPAALGWYRIVHQLGEGGMGKVYRATDTKLRREVAIKVLPREFQGDASRLARFEREARVLASLNHPHIGAIYGLEAFEGVPFLVLELVEGPTLAERIARGPVPPDEALAIAAQIVEALEYAHERNVIHRDLKPANIKLTPDGSVKVLDFGLAKALADPAPAGDPAVSPTVTMGGTATGVILGTAAYMSPEQARGKPLDKRTDIWSFGVVLYEMLTGKPLFRCETVSETLASVLKDAPDFETVPAQFRPLLRRCLEKDPQKRLRDIGDAMALVNDGPAAAATALAPTTPQPRLRTWMVFATASAFLLSAAVAALTVWFLKPAAPKPVTRFAMSLPPGLHLFTGSPSVAVAISPDGRSLVYSAGQGIATGSLPSIAGVQLYLRAMDGLEARAISGTEGGVNPFFSPDGKWVGFSVGGKLKKVSLSGGPPVSVADISPLTIGVASWGSQGIIAFAQSAILGLGGPVQKVSDAGGRVQPLTRFEKVEGNHAYPQLLPNGKGVLFNITNFSAGIRQVAAQSLTTGERRDLLPSGTFAHYAPSGHIVYTQGMDLMLGTNLMGAPFDLRRLTVTGAPVPVIEGVLNIQYSFSSAGTLVYVPGPNQAQLKLVWVDRRGMEQPVPAPAHNYVLPRISPDGRRIAAGIEETESQIWLYDLTRDNLTRLTSEGNTNIDPVWTPDGKRIAYKGAGNRLFWQPADGSGAAEALTNEPLSANNPPGSWSPDGQVLVFTETPTWSTWTLSLKDRKPQLFDRIQARETAPRFSPDGRWIAYDSDETGRHEIFVRPYPGPGGKSQISNDGGTEPAWNPKGGELFYRNRDKMMAVQITTQPAFLPGKPRILFEGAYVPTPRSFPDYDVSPDGQRFLMLKTTERSQGLDQINVVLNWFEELKRRVPSGSN